MARARKPRDRSGGRTTPKGGNAPRPKPARPKPRRRRGMPEGPLQAGKRPSRPGFLLVLATAWIACGVYAILALNSSWKLIPGIFFIGVGVLFFRGAALTVLRREERQ